MSDPDPKFAVLLHASGLSLVDPEREQPSGGGAYVWRGVRAKEPGKAFEEAKALLLEEEPFLEEISNAPEEIRFQAEEIHRLEEDAELEEADSDYLFYTEED
ncbi:MAG: hypothetical protein R3234_09400 [Thermoanaerobaculia bacterium]|nr:hypothetical protein [Thermoanaerobaculia bacterium]